MNKVSYDLSPPGTESHSITHDPDYVFDLGKFQLCAGNFDQKGVYNEASNTEVLKCCLKQNEKLLNMCKNQCNNHSDTRHCLERCDYINEGVKRICQRSTMDMLWDEGNPFFECAHQKGCDNSDIYCINDNRFEIERCCLNNCIPSKKVDCVKHCSTENMTGKDIQFLYQHLDDIVPNTGLKVNLPPETPDNYPLYIGISLGISLVIVLIVFYIALK